MHVLLSLGLRATAPLFWLFTTCEGVPWDYMNSPSLWWDVPQTALSALPLSGTSAAHKGWSGSYWPNKMGGLAHRWAVGLTTPSFNYTLHTLAELQKMSVEELKILSPAEKYDIFNNRLDYPTVLSEWKRTSPTQPEWFGLCHGWAPAVTLYDEPEPVTLQAPENGINVPFATSDIEGLLTYYLGMYRTLSMKMVGRRCEQEANATACKEDLNAGTLMVLLGNDLGLRGRMLLLDIDPGKEVWNQPIVGYSCTRQDLDTPDHVQMTCNVKYIVETGQTWDRQITQSTVEVYKFVLDLTAGSITGGTYLTDNKLRHPDFAWSAITAPAFTGYMSRLKTIYEASIANASTPDESPVPSPSPSTNPWWQAPSPSPSPSRWTSSSPWSETEDSPSPSPRWTVRSSPSPRPSPSPSPSPSPASTTGSSNFVQRWVWNASTGRWELRWFRIIPAASPSPSPSPSPPPRSTTSNGWTYYDTDPMIATYGGRTYVYDATISRWVLRSSSADYSSDGDSRPRRPMHTNAIVEPLYSAAEEAMCRPSEVITMECPAKGSVCQTAISYRRSAHQPPPMCAMWKVYCPIGYFKMLIKFSEFDTSPRKTEVRVYEAVDGPVQATLSGHGIKESGADEAVRVAANSVRVVFESLAVASASNPEHISFTVECFL